MMIGAY
jgi:hypothetical protein